MPDPVPTTNLQPPGPFDFTAEEWPKWKRRFERYRIASGLEKSPDATQVNTLLYVMGDAAEDIFASFSWTVATDAAKYDAVVAKFESHFIPRRNVIHERYMFYKRHQQHDESVDNFITALYTLSEHCEFGANRDEQIRDHIVLGIRDGDLSKKLQITQDLTLTKAIQMVRTHESVEKEGQLQRSDAGPSTIDSVNRASQRPKQGTRRQQSENSSQRRQCTRCGGPDHPRRDCPAATARCDNCRAIGHYQKMCRSSNRPSTSSRFRSTGTSWRNVRAVEADSESNESDESESSFFIGRVRSIRRVEAEWLFVAKLDDQTRTFEIDSGADETVVPASFYDKQYKLYKTNIHLGGPDQQSLRILGVQKLPITYQGTTLVQKVFLVKNQKTALLGKPAIRAFNLIERVNRVKKTEPPEKTYRDRFEGLGNLAREYKIVLNEGAKPFAIKVPRKIPLPLLDLTKKALMEEVKLGIISKITEPTDWVAPLVVVPKKDKSVRLCVDYSKLNLNVKREYFPMPNIEVTLSNLQGGKLYSKLDANSGFHQVRLAEDSKKLTTFLTPFGRFYFNRLPMGITSAPEHFQSQMQEILHECDNVVCHMDDILVWGRDEAEHDKNLTMVLEKLRQANVTLNAEKCQFRKKAIKFLGNIVENGKISPDPEKIRAVTEMTPPKTKKELQSILGTLNFLARHIPNRSENLEPLHALLRKDTPFQWDQAQQEAFIHLKKILSTAPVLSIYDKSRPLIVSSDASSYGIGAVLLQLDEKQVPHPVSYISRTLTPTEQRYAQIEKELLAITWACEKFDKYLIGLQFKIETDHKPLVPILNSKFLDDLSPRLQRLRMRLLRFSFVVSHTPGKDLVTADLLSRKPVGEAHRKDKKLQKELQQATINNIKLLRASSQMLSRIRHEQNKSEIGQQLHQFLHEGWPTRVPEELAEYSRHQSSLHTYNELILYCHRIWIPHSMRNEILTRLHQSHMGQTKMNRLAELSVWWPGIRRDITRTSETCTKCAEARPNKSEPLITTPLPANPWEKIGVDLLKHENKWYIVLIDYYSKYIELNQLQHLTSKNVIQHLETIFARHGVPLEVFTDNDTQLTSREMLNFAKEWDFAITTRSPSYPQANGLAEAAVKIAKQILKQSSPAQALLLYRATPTSVGYSPTQLLMNRQIRTTIPSLPHCSNIPPRAEVSSRHEKRRLQMESQFNKARGAKPLPEITPGTRVYVADIDKRGTVVRKRKEPRSYDVKLSNEMIVRRNRKTLRCPKRTVSLDEDMFPTTNAAPRTPKQQASSSSSQKEHPSSPTRPRTMSSPSKIPKPITSEGVTRYGRHLKEPERYQAPGPLRDRSKSESDTPAKKP